MHRILKAAGSIYLHCDPTASHYLKLLMDTIFHVNNFKNEIVWGYRTSGIGKRNFPRKHDIILYYNKNINISYHNPIKEKVYYDKPFFSPKQDASGRYYNDVFIRDVWDDKETKPILAIENEKNGYPTQKPISLLKRIIEVSCPPKGVVLDPFCGSGTTCVVAKRMERKWVGIDVNEDAIEVAQDRLRKEF